jgi:hypothetical protein
MDLAELSGRDPQTLGPGAMTYQLRRLRLHGMIERVPNSYSYRVTQTGFRTAPFFTRTYTSVACVSNNAKATAGAGLPNSPDKTASQPAGPTIPAKSEPLPPSTGEATVPTDEATKKASP